MGLSFQQPGILPVRPQINQFISLCLNYPGVKSRLWLICASWQSVSQENKDKNQSHLRCWWHRTMLAGKLSWSEGNNTDRKRIWKNSIILSFHTACLCKTLRGTLQQNIILRKFLELYSHFINRWLWSAFLFAFSLGSNPGRLLESWVLIVLKVNITNIKQADKNKWHRDIRVLGQLLAVFVDISRVALWKDATQGKYIWNCSDL